MSSDRVEQARELFLAVLDLPPGERDVLLDERCGDDSALRGEIESLLAHDEQGRGVMDPPVLVPEIMPAAERTTLEDAPRAPVSTRIGHYEIRGIIASGGMGTVYEAVQDHPHRLVALKVLRHGVASRQAMKRFHHEAEILGRLRHPNIAQIYDAGTWDEGEGSTPYFAMELVKGRPLVESCDARALGPRDRLELFAGICDAVQYAHHKGVIHRDLKPDNILVDDAGEPKVLDFGIARATDADIRATTLRTDVGQLIGTIPYMSPEQVSGDPGELDTRSDVYSLGVVLYELMCGRLPHDLRDRSIPDAVRIIREENPTSLSSIDRTLRGDIETIVAKALEKEKTRRYQTAAELAADVRRYLADEPIVARPPSTFYQLRKFTRRNRTLVIGVTGMSVLLVAGFIGTTWGLFQARNETAKATATNEYLMTLLALANPAEASDEMAEFGGLAGVRTIADLIDEASRMMETAFPDWPLVRADMHLRLGKTYWGLGRREEMGHHVQHALEIYTSELGENHPTTLDSLFWHGRWLREGIRYGEAETAFRTVLDGFLKVLGADDRRTLHATTWYVTTIMNLGEYQEGEEQYLELIETATRVLGPQDKITLTAQHQYAYLLGVMARHPEQERVTREALETARRDLPKGDLVTAKLALMLGHSLRHQQKYEDALKAYEEAYDICHHDRVGVVMQALQVMTNMAVTLERLNRADEAEAIIRAKLDDCRRELGEDHDRTLWARFELGRNLQAQGRLEDAERILRETIEYYVPLKGKDQYYVLFATQTLARLLSDQDRHEAAEELFRQAYEARVGANAEDTFAMYARRDLAGILVKQGKLKDGLALYREQLEVQRRVHGPDQAVPLWAMMNVAWTLGRIGPEHYSESETLLRDADKGMISVLGENHRFRLDVQWRLGAVLYLRDRIDEALDILDDNLDRYRRTQGEEHANTQFVLRDLTRKLEEQQRFGELADLYDEWDQPRKAAAYRDRAAEPH